MRIYDRCPMNCGNEIVYISYAVLLGPYDVTQLTHAAPCWKGKHPKLRKIAKKIRRNAALKKRAKEEGLSLADYRARRRGMAEIDRSLGTFHPFGMRNPDGTTVKLNLAPYSSLIFFRI